MGLLDTLTGLFGGKKKGGMPDLGGINDMKEKAADMLEQHEEVINKVTDAIPGEADDQLVEKAKDVLQ